MALYIPKKVVLNWYKYDISFSICLLSIFIDSVEEQAAKSIADFKANVQTEVVDHGGGMESSHVHRGLDSSTWALEEVCEKYFPGLQRRSALLTLWSYLEHELDELCVLYKSEKGFRLTHLDLSGKGIDRSTGYLEKVAGLSGLKTSRAWREIKEIQKIRNAIAHRDGKLGADQGTVNTEFIKKAKGVRLMIEGDEIVLEEGFLTDVLVRFKSYFELIAASINANEGAARAASNA